MVDARDGEEQEPLERVAYNQEPSDARRQILGNCYAAFVTAFPVVRETRALHSSEFQRP